MKNVRYSQKCVFPPFKFKCLRNVNSTYVVLYGISEFRALSFNFKFNNDVMYGMKMIAFLSMSMFNEFNETNLC